LQHLNTRISIGTEVCFIYLFLINFYWNFIKYF
jgi:hypothetical protein